MANSIKDDVTSNKWGPSSDEKGSVEVPSAQGRKEGAKNAVKKAVKNRKDKDVPSEDKGKHEDTAVDDEIIARLDRMKNLKGLNE